MRDSRLPRVPPPPLTGDRLCRHFEAQRQLLWARGQSAVDLNSLTIGDAREWFVRDFLEAHLPANLEVGSGHLIDEDWTSPQIDLLITRDSALSLPLGPASLYFASGVVACVEVKSTLDGRGVAQAGETFCSLGSDVLKIIFAYRLKDSGQHRARVAAWASELDPSGLPDLVVVLDNSAIVRGGALTCLSGTGLPEDPSILYKFGSYQSDKWLGLSLLVFELACRSSSNDWARLLKPALPGAGTYQALPAS